MGYTLKETYVKNVVVGSGAAGLGAAVRLEQFGEKDTVIVSENFKAGTSRNTGSDKQTYYKLTLAGRDMDSVGNMAEDLFEGQCVDGDLALCEAALSVQNYYFLVELGVLFPCNEYGEYMGYKTDHDKGRRATSAGPYTSKMMTECLEKRVKEKKIKIMDFMQAVRILTEEGKVCGLLCLNRKSGRIPQYEIIWCKNIILATGGPAGMYQDSVYPASQTGSSGMAFAAGARGKNLTEWQFGLASLKPRWNVSGTYMQSLPRIISTNVDRTEEREFLLDYFSSKEEMLSMIFLKGYQWPFDVTKIYGGSSIIDLLVYQECVLKKRRVFLDFRSNTGGEEVPFEKLKKEVFDYLTQAGACFGTPIERLLHMNEPAVQFYKEHGVDLSKEYLEIAVCVQHNNGGLSTDKDWQTNIKGLFAVGEVCGSHGVIRPGGTALNAGQTGALRAAGYIAHFQQKNHKQQRSRSGYRQAVQAIEFAETTGGQKNLSDVWKKASNRMSRFGGIIREEKNIREALKETVWELENYQRYVKISHVGQIGLYYRLYDMLLSQKVYLSAMLDYIGKKGGSRGSALYTCPEGTKAKETLPEVFREKSDNGAHGCFIQEVELKEGKCRFIWRKVRPLPKPDYFFETQWKKYRKRMSITE